MEITNTVEFLEHYGKKGMRWGSRKRSGKEQKVRAKRGKVLKNRRTISDGDLKGYIDRLSSEKKLKDLIDNDLKPGRSIAKKIMSDSGQKVARTVAAGAGVIAIKMIVERKLSPKGTKFKRNPLEIADTIARGGLKKK